MTKLAEPAPRVETASKVVELRQYTLRPDKRDSLIEIFESNFIEAQEDAGATIIGHFRDLENPNRFVWLRGFRDMPARARVLEDFDTSAIWQEHREPVNQTLIDSDDVLLLRPAARGTASVLAGGPSSAADETAFVLATIYSSAAPLEDFIEFFGRSLEPTLTDTGARCLATFVTEPSENNYPDLPVREGENVFVWLTRFQDREAYERHLAALASSPTWPRLEGELQRRLSKPGQTLHLAPASRSRLR